MVRNLIVTVVISGGLALTTTGCGPSAEAQQHVARRTTVRPSPSSTPDAALAAYKGMVFTYAKATRRGDGRLAGLDAYAAGDALKLLTDSLQKDHRDGVVAHGGPVIRPYVKSTAFEGHRGWVQVVDCTSDRGWLSHHHDGTPIGDKPGGWHHAEALVQRLDGVWKVTRFFVMKKSGTC